MFRKMRRFKQQLEEADCIEILTNAPRGVLAVHGEEGYPYAFPMNHLYLDGKLYFHCAKEGHKLDALTKDNKVSFCVLNEGIQKEGEWFLQFKSVIAFGRIEELIDRDEMMKVIRILGLKYNPSPENVEEEIMRSAKNMKMLVFNIDHMTGKLVNES